MAQLSSESEPMPLDVFAQTGAEALKFDGDGDGAIMKKFGREATALMNEVVKWKASGYKPANKQFS